MPICYSVIIVLIITIIIIVIIICGLQLPREPHRSTRLLQLTGRWQYNGIIVIIIITTTIIDRDGHYFTMQITLSNKMYYY